MATSNIPPHNLGETVDALILLARNPRVTLDELMEKLPGPDFPTGALICGGSGIREAYRTGRGLLTVRARAGHRGDARRPPAHRARRDPVHGQQGFDDREDRGAGARRPDRRHLRRARRVRPPRHARGGRAEEGRGRPGRPEPALQDDADADHVRREHGRAGAQPAADARPDRAACSTSSTSAARSCGAAPPSICARPRRARTSSRASRSRSTTSTP